jgi:hypothetical protein
MEFFERGSLRDSEARATEEAGRHEAEIAAREVVRLAEGLEPGEVPPISLVREIGPLATVSLVACLIVTAVLINDAAIGRWLLAVVLVAHGWVHLLFLFPHPAAPAGKRDSWPFDLRTSWLVGRMGVPAGLVRGLGRALAVATFALAVLAALVTVGLVGPATLWSGLMVAAALASLGLLVLGFSTMLLIGVGVDAWMLLLALAGSWQPT